MGNGKRLFEALGESDAQNSFLKGVVVVLAIVLVAAAAAIAGLTFRPATVVSVSPTETKVVQESSVEGELAAEEVKRVAQGYVHARYTWTPETVESAMASASAALTAEGRKSFEHTAAETVKMAKDKVISQKLYVTSVEVDPTGAFVDVSGDRIVSVGGVRAVVELKSRLTLRREARSKENPEGLLITDEDSRTPTKDPRMEPK